MTKPQKPRPFPSKEQILEFIQGSPDKAGKREIARAFSISLADKPKLKKIIRELETDGLIERGRSRRFGRPGSLPDVSVLDIHAIDVDGELLARPMNWEHAEAPPKIYMAPERRGRTALAPGDRVLAKLRQVRRNVYEARTIRQISAAPAKILALYTKAGNEGRLRATDRKNKSEMVVGPHDAGGAESGDLVLAHLLPGRIRGLRKAKVEEVLGPMGGPKSISLIAIHANEIPTEFTPEAVKQAVDAKGVSLGKRTDLRTIPLVTIDGADARDYDDAVWAEPDPDHEGGWHIIVAIADVSHYVTTGSPLDKDAYMRGNSVYFPDRVVPMLPQELSNGWCSLLPNEDRPCLAAHLWVGKDGTLHKHKFERALMRSTARLTYNQVQSAMDGHPDDLTGPLLDAVIKPLYGAYAALTRGRDARGVLALDLPEKRIMVNEAGEVTGVEVRARYDSHRLIEEMMITANVAAAETLEKKKYPCMFRVHDQPTMAKLEALREFLGSLNLNLAKGQVLQPRNFNQLLEKVKDTPEAGLVNTVVLRSQAQAVYSPDNLGHFGLALRRYAHFTSPIRRYADLLVHRSLISALGLGNDGIDNDERDFETMGEHISVTERRAQYAERDATDRFTASYLSERIGSEFAGRISGVTRFGLFVTLDESGADGLIPISTLPDDYYTHVEAQHCLRGERHGQTFRLGDQMDVVLVEADPVSGSTVMRVAGVEPREQRAFTPGRKRHTNRRARPAKGNGAADGESKKKPHAKRKGKNRAARRRG